MNCTEELSFAAKLFHLGVYLFAISGVLHAVVFVADYFWPRARRDSHEDQRRVAQSEARKRP